MFETVRVRAAQPSPRAEAAEIPANRSIENLVLVIFWLLLLEGAIRKWVAPQFSQYIFFVRDPFVLLLYWHAFRATAFRGAGVFLQIGVAFAFIAVIVAFAQSLSFDNPRLLTVAAYGWRQYFLYLPLPFAMAAMLNQASVWRFVRHACVAAMLMAPLVVVQAGSSPAAVINRGIAEDESLQFQSFGYTAGRIRPSGSFTSAAGMKEFVSSTFALVLAAWLTPAGVRRISLPVLATAAAATATCLALCGSRAAFVHVFLVFLSALLVGLSARVPAVRGRALSVPIVLFFLGVMLYPVIFPEALSLMANRIAEASAVAGEAPSSAILGRALYETIDFVRFMSHTPLAGYGLGLGGNGRSYLGAIDPEFLARIGAESDWSRHIVDLGTILGVLFILYRIGFTASVFSSALKATRLSSSPMPLVLFGYVGIGLFYGQLTGHGTVGGFLWLYLGLCMASCRFAVEGK